MRRLAAVLLALSLVAGSFALLGAKPKPATSTRPKPVPSVASDTTAAAHRVVAYYFHGNFRCSNCMKIEAYSKEAIEQAFAGEIKDGRLVWTVVNTEEKGNEHFTKDYHLYMKSLVLVDEVKGKQARWKNLEKVWEYLQDKPAFLRYVQGEVRGYLPVRS